SATYRGRRQPNGKNNRSRCGSLLIRGAVPGLVAAGLLRDEEETNVALKMTNREVDGVAVVALDGRIVLGEESNALREKVKALMAEGKKKVVLNMDNITFIDSAGLGTLVAAHHSVKTQGASLRLCHLGSKFQEVLQITKLLTVFDVYNSEAEAVSSFSKGAGA
ncbi:MAG TPA: STAS domain-containing protein, partial [Candidatus Acidoferrum sp.]|nr:STAS domain-containing protein [Candidatus Acidoferrum sp.]